VTDLGASTLQACQPLSAQLDSSEVRLQSSIEESKEILVTDPRQQGVRTDMDKLTDGPQDLRMMEGPPGHCKARQRRQGKELNALMCQVTTEVLAVG